MATTKQASDRLDVRPLPPPERHGRILAELVKLAAGATLTVVTDHEPRPLRLKLEALFPERYLFAQRQFGIGHWEITLRQAAPGLRRSALFADAGAETVAALERHAVERTFANGATLVEQDAPWSYLGLVRAGTLASVMASTSGRDQKLFDILAGETFGIVETLDGGRTVARIVATSAATRVVLFPRGIVLSAMAGDATFARALTMICAQRTRRLAERFAEHHAQPALARVAAAILPYAAPDAGLAPSLEPLRRMTQAQLALSAGTAKEVAARAIAALEARGAIERAHGRIARIDRAKLNGIVQE